MKALSKIKVSYVLIIISVLVVLFLFLRLGDEKSSDQKEMVLHDQEITSDLSTASEKEFRAGFDESAEKTHFQTFSPTEKKESSLSGATLPEFAPLLPDVLHFNLDVIPSVIRSKDSYYHKSLAPEDHKIHGMETLYRRFPANVNSGLITQNLRDRKWIFQRWLFEQPFQYFLTRAIASPEVPFLDGRSRLNTICTPGRANCLVGLDGSYYPCVRLPSCEEFRIGDMRNGIDVEKSYGFRKKYIEFCEDECRHCWCVNICHMNCCSEVRDGQRITAEAKRKACDEFLRILTIC